MDVLCHSLVKVGFHLFQVEMKIKKKSPFNRHRLDKENKTWTSAELRSGSELI